MGFWQIIISYNLPLSPFTPTPQNKTQTKTPASSKKLGFEIEAAFIIFVLGTVI